MKMIVRIALIAALAATSLAFVRDTPVRHAPTIYAFTNVSVLAMDAERLAAEQTANAVRIDGRGKYLMPGRRSVILMAAKPPEDLLLCHSKRKSRSSARYARIRMTTLASG